MEFQANPATQKDHKDVRMLLRAHGLIHGSNSALLPLALLLSTGGLVTFQHFATNDTGRQSSEAFLAKVLMSMLPLIILEMKIVSCSDPIRLFSRFSTKVLLMHASFLGLRLITLPFPDIHVDMIGVVAFAFVAACVLLPAVFRLRPALAHAWEHRDVLALVFLSICAGVVEVTLAASVASWNTWMSHKVRLLFLEDLILTVSDNIELLAFVPAVWMAYRQNAGGIPTEVDIKDSQTRAFSLFAFVLMFYFFEDLTGAWNTRRLFPVAAAGHVAHYLVLLDFAAFLLAHLYDPERFAKLKGAILGWVAAVSAV